MTSSFEENSSMPQVAAQPLERSILVTLLEHPDMLKGLNDSIDESDFQTDAARKIFRWIKAESKAGRVIDAVLAMNAFAGKGVVEGYLMDVLSGIPSPSTLKRHMEELRSTALRAETFGVLKKALADVVGGQTVEGTFSRLSNHINMAQQRLAGSAHTGKSYAQVQNAWKQKFKDRASGKFNYTKTGFDDLDELILGLDPQSLVIIGARPSMGKTTFSMNIVEKIAIEKNGRCLVFSMEMPEDQIYQRSLCSIGGLDFNDLRSGKLKTGDWEKIELASSILKDAPIFIDDEPGLSLEQLTAKAHSYTLKYGKFSAILIDYIQIMRLSEHLKHNPNQAIGEITRGLKQLARDLDTTVIALSQLSRNLESRPDKRPINSDLRDSGSIEQDADVIMFLYRDLVYNPNTTMPDVAEIIIGKQRNGPLGTAYLGFEGKYSRFYNMSAERRRSLEEALRAMPLSMAKGKKKAKAKMEGGTEMPPFTQDNSTMNPDLIRQIEDQLG